MYKSLFEVWVSFHYLINLEIMKNVLLNISDSNILLFYSFLPLSPQNPPKLIKNTFMSAAKVRFTVKKGWKTQKKIFNTSFFKMTFITPRNDRHEDNKIINGPF